MMGDPPEEPQAGSDPLPRVGPRPNQDLSDLPRQGHVQRNTAPIPTRPLLLLGAGVYSEMILCQGPHPYLSLTVGPGTQAPPAPFHRWGR